MHLRSCLSGQKFTVTFQFHRSVSLPISVGLSVCLASSVCLSISVWLPIFFLSVSLPICLASSVCLSLSGWLSICMSLCLFGCLCVGLSLYVFICLVIHSSSDCKLEHCTGVYKSNRGPVPTGEFPSLQFHCFRIYSNKNMMSSVESILNRSYPRFASTTTTTTATTTTTTTTAIHLSGYLSVCLLTLYLALWSCVC